KERSRPVEVHLEVIGKRHRHGHAAPADDAVPRLQMHFCTCSALAGFRFPLLLLTRPPLPLRQRRDRPFLPSLVFSYPHYLFSSSWGELLVFSSPTVCVGN